MSLLSLERGGGGTLPALLALRWGGLTTWFGGGDTKLVFVRDGVDFYDGVLLD